MLILGALMSAILKWWAGYTVFANFQENKSRSKQKKNIPRLLTHRGLSLSEI